MAAGSRLALAAVLNIDSASLHGVEEKNHLFWSRGITNTHVLLHRGVFAPWIQICAFIKIKGSLSVFLNTLFDQLSIQARSVTEAEI